MSSYQKMKSNYEAEISELQNDILCLLSDNEIDVIQVKLKWEMRIAIMRTMYPKNTGNGFLDLIQKCNL